MGIKELKEKIKAVFGKQDNEFLVEKKIEKIEEKIEHAEDNTIEEATEEAVKVLYDSISKITKNMQPEEKEKIIGILVSKLSENENDIVAEEIPAAVMEKMLEDSDEIPNKHLVEPVGMLPDEKVAEIARNDEIPLSDRRTIVQKAIDNEETRKEELEKISKEESKRDKLEEEKYLKKLQTLYKQCDAKKPDSEIAEDISKIMKQTKKITPRMQDKINEIIARKMAYNYKQYGSTFLARWDGILSAKKMLKVNMPSLVQEEYAKFSGERKIKEDEEVRKIISKEISKEADNEYNEVEEIENIIDMLNGYESNERRQLIETFKSVLEKDKEGKTYRAIINSRLVDVFSKIEDDKTTDKMLQKIKESVINFEYKKEDKVQSDKNDSIRQDAEELKYR